jgi:predicted Zn-dependent protease
MSFVKNHLMKKLCMQIRRQTIMLCSVVFLLVQSLMPANVMGITIKEEEELSREFLKVIEKRYELIRDPLITGYVNTVGKNILATMPPQPFAYHFYVVKQHVYNAFATPAGHIFINSGLLEALEREDELAGILAHEIAHVVCRHISQNIDRAPKIGLATLAGIAAGIFLGVGGTAALGNAVAIGSIAAGQSVSLAFSREDELQADQLALDYLYKAGYGAEGLLSSLKKLRSKQWFGTEQVPDYLMTHPASEERMAFIDSWIERNELPPGSKRADNQNEFLLVKTTLQGKYGDEQTSMPALQSRVQASPDDPLANYGYALALAKAGNRKTALDYMKKALEKEALNPYMLKELGRIYFLDGQYEKARKVLEGAISLTPNDTEGRFYLARSYMELDQLQDAADAFHSLQVKDPDNKETYLFLGNIYGQQDKLGEAHYYLGIYHKMSRHWKTAAIHLNKALQYTTDPKKKEELEAMLKVVQKEIKNEANAKQ